MPVHCHVMQLVVTELQWCHLDMLSITYRTLSCCSRSHVVKCVFAASALSPLVLLPVLIRAAPKDGSTLKVVSLCCTSCSCSSDRSIKESSHVNKKARASVIVARIHTDAIALVPVTRVFSSLFHPHFVVQVRNSQRVSAQSKLTAI